MATGPHISLSAETLFEVGGFPITNSVLTSLIVSALLILLAFYTKSVIKPTSKPTGFQNFIEMVVESLYNFVHSVTQNTQRTRLFFPLIATFFLFIIVNNWIGVFPGVGTILIEVNEETHQNEMSSSKLSAINMVEASEMENAEAAHEAASSVMKEKADGNEETKAVEAEHNESEGEVAESEHAESVPLFRAATADLNTTLALALISVSMTQVFGIKYLSLGYFKKFLNFSNPIMFVVGILEIISELAKVMSFAFRLFGNIFAGEVLLVVIAYIGGNFLFFAPMPFYGLEFFVGFIQALVFAMLSLVFFNMATHSHEEH